MLLVPVLVLRSHVFPEELFEEFAEFHGLLACQCFDARFAKFFHEPQGVFARRTCDGCFELRDVFRQFRLIFKQLLQPLGFGFPRFFVAIRFVGSIGLLTFIVSFRSAFALSILLFRMLPIVFLIWFHNDRFD